MFICVLLKKHNYIILTIINYYIILYYINYFLKASVSDLGVTIFIFGRLSSSRHIVSRTAAFMELSEYM